MTRLHEWTLSGLQLATPSTNRPASGFWFETFREGVSLGEPEAVTSIRETLALDGDDERTDRYGNRTIEFDVADLWLHRRATSLTASACCRSAWASAASWSGCRRSRVLGLCSGFARRA